MNKKLIHIAIAALFICLLWQVPVSAGILDETIEVYGKTLELNRDYSDGIVIYDSWRPEETLISVGLYSGTVPDGMSYRFTNAKEYILTGTPTKEGVFTIIQPLDCKSKYAPGEVFERIMKITVVVKKAETVDTGLCCFLDETNSYDIDFESADEVEVIESDLPDGMSYTESAGGAQISGIPKESGEFFVKIRLYYKPIRDKAPKYKNIKIVVIDPKNSSEAFVAEKGVYFSQPLILSGVNREMTDMILKSGEEPAGVRGTYSMAGTRISGTPEVSGRFEMTYEYTFDDEIRVPHTVYLTIYEKTTQSAVFNLKEDTVCALDIPDKEIKVVTVIDGSLPGGMKCEVRDKAAVIVGKAVEEKDYKVIFEVETVDGSLYQHTMFIHVKKQESDIDDVINPYGDVSEGDWFYEAVLYNYANGLMTGMTDTTFGPYGTLSRAQFALILYRMEGTPIVETDKSFGDISGTEWYGQAVLWAAENNIVTGYQNGNFGPVDDITREQMALMMYRYASYLGKDTAEKADISGFADAERVSEFAKEAMMWANGNGIITGKDSGTKLDPQGNTARAEAAAIIQRFMKN